MQHLYAIEECKILFQPCEMKNGGIRAMSNPRANDMFEHSWTYQYIVMTIARISKYNIIISVTIVETLLPRTFHQNFKSNSFPILTFRKIFIKCIIGLPQKLTTCQTEQSLASPFQVSQKVAFLKPGFSLAPDSKYKDFAHHFFKGTEDID